MLKICNQGRTCGNGFMREKFRFGMGIRMHCFNNRVVDEWSKLPSSDIETKTLCSFKIG